VIDIENEVFTQIAAKLREEFNGISVYGEYTKAPAKFPAVSIEEKANTVYQRTQDSGNIENHASLMYEVNVYSNKKTGKKSECKDIFSVIDDEFSAMGFTRILKDTIPNLEDATIYRMIGRYTAIVSKENEIIRR
jgi:hypothetical protein